MTGDEVIQFVSGLPGVDVVTLSTVNRARQVSWGDMFFFYHPGGGIPVGSHTYRDLFGHPLKAESWQARVPVNGGRR